MDAAKVWDKNDLIVVIVQLYGKIIMKTNCVNNSFDITECVADASRLQRVIPTVRSLQKTLICYSRRWLRRRQLKSALLSMNVRLVEKDIGVSRGTLREEAYKPFWQK